MTHPASRAWRTSSRSGSGNNCVQAATARSGIALRDSKNPHGPELAFTPGAWHTFIQAIKASTPPLHQP